MTTSIFPPTRLGALPLLERVQRSDRDDRHSLSQLDQVTLGAAETPSIRPHFSLVRDFPKSLHKLTLATALAVSLFTAVAPLPAFAATPVAHATIEATYEQQEPARKLDAQQQQQAVDGTVAEVLASLKGKDLKALGPQCVDLDAKCKADFETLTREAQEGYRKMPLVAKQTMAKQLSGGYKLLGFIPVVNYRKAYENGEAFGKNVFEFVTGKVNEKEARGELTPSNAHHARWFLQVSSRMTKAQRQALVRIVNQDVKLAR